MDKPEIVVTPEILARINTKPTAGEAQHAWKFLIACDLFLAALGPGVFIMAVFADWVGLGLTQNLVSPFGGWNWDWAAICTLWGPFASALGGCLVILHLGRNWYKVETAVKNPRTSWMARGIMIMASFIVLGVCVALIAVLFPSWPEAMGPGWRALQAVAMAFAFGTVLYTGMLLRSMKFITAWRSDYLPLVFTASALSMGAMGVLFGAGIFTFIAADPSSGEDTIWLMRIIEPVMTVALGVMLVLYLRDIKARGKPEALASLKMWLTGSWRIGFWGGIVGMGIVGPLFLDLVNLGLNWTPLAMLGACGSLLGGFVIRFGVLSTGVKATTPLYKYGEWRVAHPLAAGKRASESMAVDSATGSE